MYGTSCVIHVRASTEMPPPPASRQASPAIQQRPLGPINMRRPGPRAAGWLDWPGGWPAAAASLSMQSCTIHVPYMYHT